MRVDEYQFYGRLCHVFGIICRVVGIVMIAVGILIPFFTTEIDLVLNIFHSPYLGSAITLVGIGIVLTVFSEILFREWEKASLKKALTVEGT